MFRKTSKLSEVKYFKEKEVSKVDNLKNSEEVKNKDSSGTTTLSKNSYLTNFIIFLKKVHIIKYYYNITVSFIYILKILLYK